MIEAIMAWVGVSTCVAITLACVVAAWMGMHTRGEDYEAGERNAAREYEPEIDGLRGEIRALRNERDALKATNAHLRARLKSLRRRSAWHKEHAGSSSTGRASVCGTEDGGSSPPTLTTPSWENHP